MSLEQELSEIETWKDVPGFPDYQVSDMGRIRSKSRLKTEWKILAHKNKHKYSYMYVTLVRGSVHKRFRLHRLIAEVFLGASEIKRHVLHINGNSRDNRLANLKYGTQIENYADMIRHKTAPIGERNGQAVFTEEDIYQIKVIGSWNKFFRKDIGRLFGTDESTISQILTGKRWKHVTIENPPASIGRGSNDNRKRTK